MYERGSTTTISASPPAQPALQPQRGVHADVPAADDEDPGRPSTPVSAPAPVVATCARRVRHAGLGRRSPRRSQDVVEHRLGEPAGERVLLAGVVAADHAAARPARHRRRRGRTSAAGAARRRPGPAAARPAALPRRTRRGRRSPAASASSRPSSRSSHGAQVSRSAGVGLLSGGAQRTAAEHPGADQRAARRRRAGWSAGWRARPGAARRRASRRCGRR